jgi:hypothetical protein
MLAPYKGRIYDPARGSGGLFVQSETFVESHGGEAKCEVRSASVEVKTLRAFDIRNSAFSILPVLQPVRRLPCAERIFKAEGQTAEPAKATRHPPRPHRGRSRGLHL